MTGLDRDFQEEPEESYLFPSTVSLCINGMNLQKSICLPSFPSKEPRSLTHISLELLSPTFFPTKLTSHHPLGLTHLLRCPTFVLSRKGHLTGQCHFLHLILHSAETLSGLFSEVMISKAFSAEGFQERLKIHMCPSSPQSLASTCFLVPGESAQYHGSHQIRAPQEGGTRYALLMLLRLHSSTF